MIADSNTPVSHPSEQASNSIQRQKSSEWKGGGARATQRCCWQASCLRMAPGNIQEWVMSLWTNWEVGYLSQVCASACRAVRRFAYAWHLEISKSESCPCGQNERLRTFNRCAPHGREWGKATGHALGVGPWKGSADCGEGSKDASEYEL